MKNECFYDKGNTGLEWTYDKCSSNVLANGK